MIVQYKSKTNVDHLCQWAGVAKSSAYYAAHPGPRGIVASTHTIVGGCGLVENSLVVDQMRAILSMDYCVYGYRKMTEELRDLEYLINPKKVYRLMKENHLLCGKRINVQGKRKWVKHRRIEAGHLMEYLCLDINTFGCREKAAGIINWPSWTFTATGSCAGSFSAAFASMTSLR